MSQLQQNQEMLDLDLELADKEILDQQQKWKKLNALMVISPIFYKHPSFPNKEFGKEGGCA